MSDPNEQIPATDWDRLSPEAKYVLRMLAGMREGRTISEMADRLTVAADSVVDFIQVDDNGNASGPKGSVTLVLKIAPNRTDNSGGTVVVSDEIKSTRPEDRSHVMYVGRGGTLHTRQQGMRTLFDLAPGGRAVASGGGGGDDDRSPFARAPYKDD